jgi:hypothetical protein
MPKRYVSGKPYSGAHNLYYVDAADTSAAIAVGDVVTLLGNMVAVGTTYFGIPVHTMPTVTRFVASDALAAGVVVGVLPNPNALSTNHLPASTSGILMVADDPDIVFEVQESDGGTAYTADMVGLNTDLLMTAPNTTTGTSQVELDTTVTPVTTTLTVRLLKLVNRPDNALGANARWEVKFIEHSNLSATGIA